MVKFLQLMQQNEETTRKATVRLRAPILLIACKEQDGVQVHVREDDQTNGRRNVMRTPKSKQTKRRDEADHE